MLIVKKFGGEAVANTAMIQSAAKKCVDEYKKGNKVVAVISAMGDTTDKLLELAKSVNSDASARELDMLLSTGEQVSVSLFAMAINAMGIPAISLNASQVAMHTSSVNGNARLKRIDTDRIKKELGDGKIVVVTGFQGVDKYDNITTLGRGGSATTAVALAATLRAAECQIYTAEDGIYTANPHKVSNAKKLDMISYDEVLELATLGTMVLHNRSVELAKKYDVKLVVRSYLNDEEGTVITEDPNMERMLVSGIATDKNAARIAVMGVKNEPGVAFKVFDILAQEGINVDIILQSIGRDDSKDISFTVSRDVADKAAQVLETNKDRLTIKEIGIDKTVAKVSIVGAGMQTNPGVAAKLFEAMYNAGVNILMISTSEIRISMLVAENDVDRAVRAAHDAFIED